MKLAVDIGNTSISVGLFNKYDLVVKTNFSNINNFEEFINSIEEYDVTCNDMKFSKIYNGWMLNCYPENVLHKTKELLAQIRDF